jgi:3-phosphoshikimate 1-carboxyvinyltransferase
VSETVEMAGEEPQVVVEVEELEPVVVRPARRLEGELDLPGDPNVSLLALAMGVRSEGTSEILALSERPVVRTFAQTLRDRGISVESADGVTSVAGGVPGSGEGVLDAGSSPVLLGCLAGLFGGSPVAVELTADADLEACASKILEALEALGARPVRPTEGLFPFGLGGRALRPGSFSTGPPDAAVKCAMLLAGLGTEGITEVLQETAGDDDLEPLLKAAKASLEKGRVEGAEGHRVALTGPAALQATRHDLPGDATAALFVLLAASLLKRSEVSIARAGVDWKTRRMQDLVRRMDVTFTMARTRTESGFHTRQLDVKASDLRPIKIAEPYSSLLLEELPMFAVAAANIPGETIIRDAERLRAGGIDRIGLVVESLRLLGAQVGEMPDGLVVKGSSRLQGCELDAGGDASVTLALMLAGLTAEGETTIRNPGPVDEVYPGIYERTASIAVR